MRSTILKIKLLTLFSISSFTFASGQVDSIEIDKSSSNTPLFFETQVIIRQAYNKYDIIPFEIKLNIGYQQVLNDKTAFSLLTGYNLNIDDNFMDILGRASYFWNYSEVYIEGGIQYYQNSIGFEHYLGHRFACGLRNKKYNLGTFVGIRKGDDTNYHRQVFDAGITTQRKGVFFTVVSVIGALFVIASNF